LLFKVVEDFLIKTNFYSFLSGVLASGIHFVRILRHFWTMAQTMGSRCHFINLCIHTAGAMVLVALAWGGYGLNQAFRVGGDALQVGVKAA
jgi:hypothetical protein